MPLPAWPAVNYRPQRSSFQGITRSLEPISTDMEGGNTRERPRPGDNVGSVTQVIWMTAAEKATFVAWVKNTLNNGTARFTTNVWLDNAYSVKTCQFVKGAGGIKYDFVAVGVDAVTMTLRVYGV
jgi:hypothetical protein